ncbi:ABC transporter I family member 1 [Tanacetum coccineum]
MMVDPSYSQEQMGLAGFSKPSAGEILWNGHDINESGVCHQYKLQPKWFSLKEAIKRNCTVLDNVQWFEVLEHKQGKSLPALEFMGLGRLANEKAQMLSMGQRKRLQLARVIAVDRPIWLLDEPSVALDAEGVKLLEQMIAYHRSQGGIVIVATHLPIQIEDAMFLRYIQCNGQRQEVMTSYISEGTSGLAPNKKALGDQVIDMPVICSYDDMVSLNDGFKIQEDQQLWTKPGYEVLDLLVQKDRLTLKSVELVEKIVCFRREMCKEIRELEEMVGPHMEEVKTKY